MAGPTTRFPRQSALRRYPALAWLIAAGMMALLLPSGLTLPQSGPPTLAEYAPVPGAGEGRSELGDLASGQSVGLGAGGGGRSASGPRPSTDDQPAAGGGRMVRKAGTKRCVGTPPRQTEDPMSPPCIAFFEGDNGGATAKGVTTDRVVVAIESDEGNSQRDGVIVDCNEAVKPEDTPSDVACKAFMRFFNDRYQTYGRLVHLFHTHGATSTSIGVAGVDEALRPFAFGTPLLSGGSWARRGIVAMGFMGRGRVAYRDLAPMFMTYRPDTEDEMRLASTYICQQLAGRPARFSGNPLDVDKTRVFGLWAGTGGSAARDDVLRAHVKEDCDLTIKVYAEGDNRQATARMQTDGVTTVVMMDGAGVSTAATATATNHGWFPEWVVIGNSSIRGLDTNENGRLQHQAQWQHAIGLSVDYRRGVMQDQHWFRSYREGCPACPTPQTALASSDIPFIYDLLTMLFWGIQAAGPRLTAENIDRGLHAIPPQQSTDPFKPAAYFGAGNWTFVKDAMPIWWDPTGVAPGSPLRGCYRLPADGRRRRAGEWPSGDDLVRAAGVCQGDPFNT